MIVAVLDTESTGLDTSIEKIIELAISIYRVNEDNTYVQVGKTWNPLIWTPRKIDKGAQAVHGITAADLEGKPSFADIAPKLIKLLETSDLAVAHNGEAFDFPIIAFNLLAEGFSLPKINLFDTMLKGRTTTAMGKSPNLSEFCWAMGVEYDPSKAHRADYDTEILAEAFFQGLKLNYFDLSA